MTTAQAPMASLTRLVLAALIALTVPAAAAAQNGTAAQPQQADPDIGLDPLQPDFNLAALPTTLRVPRGKWAFRITHRFTRPLAEGNFGDLAADLFGFDRGAQIGLEFRYGLLPGTQIGIHRTSDRTIQFFGQHNFWHERDDRPLGIDFLVTAEGDNNFEQNHRFGIGALLSRQAAERVALYVEPIGFLDSDGDNHTFLLGFGARARIRPTVYLIGEVTPRIAGESPEAHQISFGIEKRAGGHVFQINFSNGFGTTLGQLALGARNYDDWYIGFNISRKFFR